jgi:hypothetical protein
MLMFATVTGEPLGRVPFTDVSWSQSINSSGSHSVTVEWSREAERAGLPAKLRNWRTSLALVRGRDVITAGPLVRSTWDAESMKLSLTVGDVWTLVDRLLTLDSKLKDRWKDGEVIIDEDNPSDEWVVGVTSNFRDFVANFIQGIIEWRTLPIDVPPRVPGGSVARAWLGLEMRNLAQTLQAITEEEGGPEIRWDPYIDEGGRLRWASRIGTPEIITTQWRWNTKRPGQRVSLTQVDDDGSAMVTEVIGVGGRREDKVLVSRVQANDAAMPLLQVADLSNTQETDLKVLRSHGRELLARGSVSQKVPVLKVGAEHRVRVGDWADVYIDDPWLGRVWQALKVVNVDGDTSEWLKVQCRGRA